MNKEQLINDDLKYIWHPFTQMKHLENPENKPVIIKSGKGIYLEDIEVEENTINLIYKYRVAVKDGKAINQIIISSNFGSFTFGNNGVEGETSKSWSGKVKLFSMRFPPFPSIGLNIYASGSLQYSVQ